MGTLEQGERTTHQRDRLGQRADTQVAVECNALVGEVVEPAFHQLSDQGGLSRAGEPSDEETPPPSGHQASMKVQAVRVGIERCLHEHIDQLVPEGLVLAWIPAPTFRPDPVVAVNLNERAYLCGILTDLIDEQALYRRSERRRNLNRCDEPIETQRDTYPSGRFTAAHHKRRIRPLAEVSVAFAGMTGSSKVDSGPVAAARPVAVGPFSVRFASAVAPLVDRWNALYRGFPDATAAGTAVTVSIDRLPNGNLQSRVNGTVLLEDPDSSAHELAITRALNHRKLDAEPDLVHLHAAAVARGTAAVVLGGRSGDGKSTLTAKLLRAGWLYVTDEQVTFSPDGTTIVPYPRPLTLRQAVWHLFDGVDGERRANDYHRVETTLEQLGARAAQGHVEPVLLLAPQYRATESNSLLAFASRAEVVSFLVSCCHDIDRLGTRAISLLVDLAARCHAHRLHFSDVDAAVSLVSEAFAEASMSTAMSFRVLERRSQGARANGWVISSDAIAWCFADGSGVAYRPSTRRFAQLDSVGSAVWEILAEPTAAGVLLADAPNEATALAVEKWLEHLVESGFVERS